MLQSPKILIAMAWARVPKMTCIRFSPSLGLQKGSGPFKRWCLPGGLRPLGTWPCWGLLDLGVLALSQCLILRNWTLLLPCVPVHLKKGQSNRTEWHGMEPSELWIKTKLSFTVVYVRYYVTVIKKKNSNILILSYYYSKVMGGRWIKNNILILSYYHSKVMGGRWNYH